MLKHLSEEDWNKIHSSSFSNREEEEEEVISVTKFIQFLGWGYESRNALFIPSKKMGGGGGEYLKLAMEHGVRFEPKALDMLKDHLEWIYKPPRGSVCLGWNGRILNTVDAYVRDRKTGSLGIVEIKAPFGRNFGRFEEEQIPQNHLVLEKHWRHWLQLQFYLKSHEPFGVEFGLLGYYYNRAGEENGENLLILYRIRPVAEVIPDFWKFVDPQLQLYFQEYYGRRRKEEEGYKKKKLRKKDILFLEYSSVIERTIEKEKTVRLRR